MADIKHGGGQVVGGGLFWFAGWLFTIGFVDMVWWKIIVAIVVWPYFLGGAVQ